MATTLKQQQAIDFDNGNLLVSASAGSGKTFVMIERVKRLLLEGKADINEILCVTFTVLAAREMKQKLSKKLTESLENGGDKEIIERQLDLLPTANISTIHAFCKNLLTEFFYEADLDPAFQIADDKQAETLANGAIDRLFEDLYEEKSPLLDVLLPNYFKKRSDNLLKKKVQEIYNSLISEANPFEILENGKYYYTKESVDELFNYFISEYKKTAESYLTEANKLLDDLDGTESYKKLYDYVAELAHIVKLICENNDEITLLNIANLEISKKPSKPSRGELSEDYFFLGYHERASELKDKINDLRSDIKEMLQNTREEEKERCLKTYPVYDALIKVVKLYSEYFQREKCEENVVDYSDLEHLTLKLLKNENIRKEVSSRFKYIFTDEYQDTSGVQEAILTAISHDNLFMVGDVKQSIYDFRGCNPDIFAEKFERYSQGVGGTAISLDKNFRSTKKVIDAVNNVFCKIMTKECGKVDYKGNKMVAEAKYPEDEGDVKLYTVEKNKVENKLPDGVYSVVKHLEIMGEKSGFAEGIKASQLISSLVGKKYFSISDNEYKTIDYGHIAILLRDVGKTGDKYANELVKAGIPVSAHSQKSIADYYEVRLLINILELINCFNQDIPLTAVLKSPIANISEGDLLKIRNFTPYESFVDAFNNYIKNNDDDLAKSLVHFKNYFNNLRLLAQFTPCDQLLSKIVVDCGIDIMLLSSRLGKTKLARLNRFIQFAGTKKQMVSEFLQGLDEGLSKVTMDFSGDNAVQIMSVHASKGLEFPIVILGGITKPFNERDTMGDFMIDRKMGIALNYHDKSSKISYKTIFSKYTSNIKKRREREEQMRLLYVAMTRAQNSLFLLGEYTGEKNSLPKQKHGINDVFTANNFYKMLAQEDMDVEKCPPLEDNFLIKQARQVLIGEKDASIEEIIDRNINFEYKFKDGENLAIKRSVTSVAHFDEDDQIQYESSAIFGNSDSETGTAYHHFLELSNFYNDYESEFNRLIGGHLLDEGQEKLIEKDKIKSIFEMDIFNKLKGYNLYKEQPFTCFMPGKLIDENYNGDGEVLIQGIIDLLAIKDDEAIVVDYKHSKIKNDCDLISRYKKQLELYAYAVKKVLKKEVKTTYLVNIYSGRTVEVKIS